MSGLGSKMNKFVEKMLECRVEGKTWRGKKKKKGLARKRGKGLGEKLS